MCLFQSLVTLHDSEDYRFVVVDDFGIVSSYAPRLARGNIQTMVYVSTTPALLLGGLVFRIVYTYMVQTEGLFICQRSCFEGDVFSCVCLAFCSHEMEGCPCTAPWPQVHPSVKDPSLPAPSSSLDMFKLIKLGPHCTGISAPHLHFRHIQTCSLQSTDCR